MPDHAHLLVGFAPDSLGLSSWVKSLRNALSKTLRAMKVRSPHWQKGFFDHLIRSERSYAEKYEYIVNNPVSGELVQVSEEWPYQGEIFCLQYWKDL
jgi:REP element-mobilizing transposase RayT